MKVSGLSAPASPLAAVAFPLVVAAVLGGVGAAVWGLTVPGIGGTLTDSGSPLVRDGQSDNYFVATAAFVGVSLIGGALTAAAVFRARFRRVRGVVLTLCVSCVAAVIAARLGVWIAQLRFPGPVQRGADFVGAPSVQLDGANFYAVANHPGGRLGWACSWVLIVVWPGAAMAWCAIVAVLGRLAD